MVRDDEKRTEVLEKGDIYFAYRPKAGTGAVEGLEDVQRLYMILSPRYKDLYRLITIGRKELPDTETHERNWGLVKRVGRNPDDVEDELDDEVYSTKTMGLRRLPAARPAGEGVYEIVKHDDHTHLAYKLELPKRPGMVHDEFDIEEEGSYIITVKNPENPAQAGGGLDEEQKAEFPQRLKKRFEGRSFVNAVPTELLDYEGAELVLAGAREESDIELKPEAETEASAEIFRDLKLEREKHPVKPLFEGEWE
ncbi:MAG: hypothetical protein HYV24_09085 [Deltaproteobacteria bacterium]|nr:hypothetical protein [Deltaproteobacteria bacterium]